MFWQARGATGCSNTGRMILSTILENSMAISTKAEKSEYIFSQNVYICAPKDMYEKGLELGYL